MRQRNTLDHSRRAGSRAAPLSKQSKLMQHIRIEPINIKPTHSADLRIPETRYRLYRVVRLLRPTTCSKALLSRSSRRYVVTQYQPRRVTDKAADGQGLYTPPPHHFRHVARLRHFGGPATHRYVTFTNDPR